MSSVNIKIILLLHLAILFASSQEQKFPIAAQECYVTQTPQGTGSFITHKDGHLMYFSAWDLYHSYDGGKSWQDAAPMQIPEPKDGMYDVIRLASGKLGVIGDIEIDPDENNFVINQLFWWLSSDEGKSWEGPFPMNPNGQVGLPYSGHNVVIQTNKGRIIFPVRYTIQSHDAHSDERSSTGRLKGKIIDITGHGHAPEMDIVFCYLSDDEGKTWFRSKREIFIWKDDGYGGMWPMDEPGVVELKNGNILLFGRTMLGRIYQSISEDGGLHWSQPKPTDLAGSYSPFMLARLPQTQDLICIWNQASLKEIESGLWRCRLSCAISQDDGKSWKFYKTIDVQGVVPTEKIEPFPIQMVRPKLDVGELPGDYGRIDYPSMGFYLDKVIVTYYHKQYYPASKSRKTLYIPTSWFYK